ncbi:MAG TPA: DUF4190 domain-containing protein [Pyrinomonadaceae bacterium]|nr:DUF4190 domain-containing protein [Pyrinomonadaceae bacterium]
MRRCPKCNQVFDQEWLSFCTNDGTSLVDTSALPAEPPPTMMSPPMPPSVSPSEQPTINLQTGGASQPPTPYSPPAPMQQAWLSPSQPMQTGWQPPPPPAYSQQKKQGLAIASLILGLCSITVGWCCSLGLLTAPVGIVLGIVSLVQIKNNPNENGGKPLSITGIATGAAYLLFWVLIVLIYGIAIFSGNLK